MEPDSPNLGPRAAWRGALLVALAAVIWLAAHAPLYRPGTTCITGRGTGHNDQAGYVTTARWLEETGELRSHLIYPSHLRSGDFRLYMPGHYWALAAGFRLFGTGPIAEKLPNLAAFVLTVTGTYLIGRRLYSSAAGALAAALVALSPIHVNYAFSAMSENTILAACVASFCALVHAPSRWRSALVPVLLVPPFLFRETTALLVLPMALVAAPGAAAGRWKSLLVSTGGSGLVLYLVKLWQNAAGKLDFPLSWVTDRRFNYSNAFAREPEPMSSGEWMQALGENLGRNVDAFSRRLEDRFFETPEPAMTLGLVLLAVVCLALGLKRRDGLSAGSGLACLAALLLVLTLYSAKGYRLLRPMLFCLPFLAVGFSGWAAGAVGRFRSAVRNATVAAGLLALATLGFLGNRALADELHEFCPLGPYTAEAIEGLGHDDTRVLVSPHAISLYYVYAHYPVRWSFVPENHATLELLCERHDVGTLIVERSDLRRRFPEEAALGRLGFRPGPEFIEPAMKRRYAVYSRAR